MDNVVCFIHSCTTDEWGTEMLDYLVRYLDTRGVLRKMKYLFINNLGREIPHNKYSDEKIIITNYSSETNLFENCTLRAMHLFSQFNPEYKILYMHTKGVSHTKSSGLMANIQDWINMMLYCLVDKHIECLNMLDYVDIVGCNYGHSKHEGKIFEFYSGNFWWINSDYVQKNRVYSLKDKFDAERWPFQNNPTNVNLHDIEIPLTELYFKPYKSSQYIDSVNRKVVDLLFILQNIRRLPILYGVEGKYLDVTDICHEKLVKNGILEITSGDMERNAIFTDPIFGTVKHIKIGDIKFSYDVDIRLRVI